MTNRFNLTLPARAPCYLFRNFPYSTARYALKYMPVSNSSTHELRMLHYCTLKAPAHVTNLVAAYENELTFPSAPHQPQRYHLLVMEYMAGGDLLRFVSRSNFTYTERVAR